MALSQEDQERWEDLLRRIETEDMDDTQRLLALKEIQDSADEMGIKMKSSLEDFRLATGEDFDEADENEEIRKTAEKLVGQIHQINADYAEEKAKNRIAFGSLMGKKIKENPKSAWWMIGFICAGIGTGNFFTWLASGIIILVIGHMMVTD